MRWKSRCQLGYSHLRVWLSWWPTPSAVGRRSQFLTKWTFPLSVFITWELAFPRGSGLRESEMDTTVSEAHTGIATVCISLQVSPTQCGKGLYEGAIWEASYIHFLNVWGTLWRKMKYSPWTAFIKCFAVQAETEQFWVLVLCTNFTDGK